MPVYDVRVRVNIPGLGERLVDYTGVTAPTLAQAFEKVRGDVIVEPILIRKTAD